jgi:hypothetical protein
MFWRAIVLILILTASAVLLLSAGSLSSTGQNFVPINTMPVLTETEMIALHTEAKSAMNALQAMRSQRQTQSEGN